MAVTAIDTTPYWEISGAPEFAPLSRSLSVDVAVIGGGLTGVTAAYLLKAAGLSVALVERGRCGQGETSHTTAHLTAVTDAPFPNLVRSFGAEHAQAVWDAGFAALAQIDTNVRQERIDCEFRWLPGYLMARLDGVPAKDESEDLATRLHEFAQLTQTAGFDADYLDAVPGLGGPGIRFDGQAAFHPLKYLHALLKSLPSDGCHVFEHSLVEDVTADPLTLTIGSHTISAKFVVIATHVPITGKAGALKATLLQTDLYPYSTYAVGARIEKNLLPQGLFWDMATPYYYLRVDSQRDDDFVIFGGADHKTGQSKNPREHFAQVERTLLQMLPDADITHRWSGQVIETRDRLPYIGEISPGQFVMTGFSGNGLTFGTLGAMMARDAITGRPNPWRELFDVNRTRITKGLGNYLAENKDYPYYLIRDRFAGTKGKSLRTLRRGAGGILDVDGKRVAAYRDEDGTATLLSPKCTHLGCEVAWNDAESSWDCPCHGSRFTATGKVMGGPAEEPLRPAD
jgi:glycine/D-amino acid oxidase-like deaminating enzyme/nitrite reductase/ring-hydroxylating ferredoxin subunit